MITGCQAGQHESDKTVEGFMTIFIPDRNENKHEIISMSDVEIRLGICTYCKNVYRVIKEEND